MTARLKFQPIDAEALRELWEAMVPTKVIAAKLQRDPATIVRHASALGLTKRDPKAMQPRAQTRYIAKPPPAPARAPVKGYAAVTAIAEREGCTLAQAMQRFHRSRA